MWCGIIKGSWLERNLWLERNTNLTWLERNLTCAHEHAHTYTQIDFNLSQDMWCGMMTHEVRDLRGFSLAPTNTHTHTHKSILFYRKTCDAAWWFMRFVTREDFHSRPRTRTLAHTHKSTCCRQIFDTEWAEWKMIKWCLGGTLTNSLMTRWSMDDVSLWGEYGQ